ncbi:MAG: 3-ketosteroid-9-alpha-hydroxylase reductase subunit [Syntrophaceae bacterium PtaU1.Bin231]|nr:MAG: 3-ketosteroid-9-alpha-hydroxylase reductase subunit [Syntrophaceae bacterium PtaU1.Bin231]
MEVQGMQKDMEAFGALLTKRQELAKAAPEEPAADDPVRVLARALHPALLQLVIAAVRDESASARTFRLVPAGGTSTLPPFQAGQYLSIKAGRGGSRFTRPYSISSAPSDAARGGYWEITVRRKEGGFFSGQVWRTWTPGTILEAAGPQGRFFFEPLRDSREIVAVAGGSGITPIRSLAREIASGGIDAKLTILYGIRTPGEMLFREEFADLQRRLPGRIRITHVCSEPDSSWQGACGFITADCIRRNAGPVGGKTFFLCGPPEMYRFLDGEMALLAVPSRRIRREVFGEEANILGRVDFPDRTAGRTVSIKVRRGREVLTLPAQTNETLLIALEKAGLAPDSSCRSGECGLCRSQLVAGDVWTKPESDGRREADRRLGFLHPCSSYPLADIEIEIPPLSSAAAAKAPARFGKSYDAVVIGAGNGGLCAALKLAKEGAKVLLLEQHNLPGGFATSFVRGRFEFETSLHELSNVGPPENAGFVRRFLLDECGVDAEFLPVPEAYHLLLTDRGVDVKLPFGIGPFIDAVEKAAPGSREPLTRYLGVCREVFDGIGYVGKTKGAPDPAVLMEKYPSFLTTSGYSVEEVTKTFGFPPAALDLLYPYWCYLGLPVSRLSFTIWALVLYDYLFRGAFIPKGTSHALSAAIDARLRALGGHTAYGLPAARILVEDGRAAGIVTADGETVRAPWVISNASPDLVYGNLIEPRDAVPPEARKLANARRIGASAFVVYLGLDAPPEKLNIESYGYFIGPDMDTEKAYRNFFAFEPPRMQAAVCLNIANPGCSPPGTTILSMTALAGPDSWKDVKPADYARTKREFAAAMIEQFSRAVGAPLADHIEEIEIAAPPTFARYTGAFKGSIYAYEQDPWDSVIARSLSYPQERFIRGLEFVGGSAEAGSGYEATYLSGRTAAQRVLARLRKTG